MRCCDATRIRRDEPFPADPRAQLARAAEAVFRPGDAAKARAYRAAERHAWKTPAPRSRSRRWSMAMPAANPAPVSASPEIRQGGGSFITTFQFKQQGEDVVAGRQAARRRQVARHAARDLDPTSRTLACHELELLFGDAQDFEFTVQSGIAGSSCRLRHAKRTLLGGGAIAVDMVEEGLCRSRPTLCSDAGGDSTLNAGVNALTFVQYRCRRSRATA